MLHWGKLEISAGFLLAAAALFYLDTENILLWVVLAGGLHEFGHYFTTRALGGHIKFFRLSAVGGEMQLDRAKPLTYGRELAAILAGPAMNLMTATVVARFIGGERGWLFAGLNLSLGMFNLLPVYPLDGGRALLLILHGLVPEPWATRLAQGSSIFTVAVLLTAGAELLRRTRGNFTLLLVALWLAVGMLLQPETEGTRGGFRRRTPKMSKTKGKKGRF